MYKNKKKNYDTSSFCIKAKSKTNEISENKESKTRRKRFSQNNPEKEKEDCFTLYQKASVIKTIWHSHNEKLMKLNRT